MLRQLFVHRILSAFAAFGMLAWAGTAWANERPNFEASGTTTVTSGGVPFEEPLIADIEGESPQLGSFSGTFVSNLVGNGQTGIGVATLQFEGDTLVLEIPDELGADFIGHGAWRVIGGPFRLAGALHREK